MTKQQFMRENACYGDILDDVISGLKKISFGEIIITIHDSRVVQVEHREKKRFSKQQKGDCAHRAQQKEASG